MINDKIKKLFLINGLIIFSLDVYGSDVKPFVGTEFITSTVGATRDNRAAFLNLGIDYNPASLVGGGMNVTLGDQSGSERVSLKSDVFVKYNVLPESQVNPFILAGVTGAILNRQTCPAEQAAGDNAVSGDGNTCGSSRFNSTGTTYGLGATIKTTKTSAVIIKYSNTTGSKNVNMNIISVGVTF